MLTVHKPVLGLGMLHDFQVNPMRLGSLSRSLARMRRAAFYVAHVIAVIVGNDR